MQFANFDIDGFLSDYWQKKPLLIKNPWQSWENPIEPDDLAGLACEDAVESRLIMQTGDASSDAWRLEHGPFPESRFDSLGEKRWTLLVQAVDHYVPAVAALMDPFRFIPNWRMDDVMISLAADEGGVGPHYDQYDVFLIQGKGKRRWQLGAKCHATTPMMPHDDLRLLAQFQANEEWVLEAGDILYVPPGVAHNGVAMGEDCMTYSIGFRAPARSELIAHFCDDVLGRLHDDDRYQDYTLSVQHNPGEISSQALAQAHAMITQHMLDADAFARWFGGYTSTRKYPDVDWQPEAPINIEQLRAPIADGEPLCRNPASRFSFIRQSEDAVLLFVDGNCHECSGEGARFAQSLCAQSVVSLEPALLQSEDAMALLQTLYNQGSVAFDIED